ncbi:MAG TPA: hypothetical protein VFV41_02190 [Streptosporangiaceae bacterium]|nr:hypothetical protein [Streptosporangiaceae bacterium]
MAQDGVDAEPATAVRAMALTALRMAGQQGSGSGAAGPAAPASPAGAVPRQGRAAGAAGARLSKAGAAAGAHAASVLPSAAGPAVPGLPAGRWDDATAQLPSPARDHAPDNGRGPAKDDVPARDGGTAKLGVPAGDHAPDKGRGLARDDAPAGDHARARGRGPAKLGGPAKVAGPAKDGAPDPEDEPGDSAARAAAGKVRAGRRGRRALAGAFAELEARCAQLRAEDGIDNVIVMAHGAAALPAALWCAAQPPGGQADALILYGPEFAGAIREGLDIDCPVLIIGGSGGQQRRGPALRRRPAPAPTAPLGRHVTWLHPADGDARPDAEDAADRSRFFDEMGRWLGAYMYGQVRDQLL